MREFTKPMVAALVAVVLSACGGGGDDGGDGSNLPPVLTANQPPVAQAGTDQTVDEGASVVLDGRASTDTDGSISAYAWQQASGPAVVLGNAATAQPSFTAPDVDANQTLVFTLTVTDDDGATASDSVSVTVEPAPPALPVTLTLSNVQLAQTHLLPPEGLSWMDADDTVRELHLTGQRAALFLTDVSPAALDSYTLEGRAGGSTLGSVSLDPNSSLPPTEAAGPRYSSSLRVARIPASWVKPGLQLRVGGSGATATAWQTVNVGADNDFTVRTLPFYLFGASESDVSLAVAGAPPAAAKNEMFAKWPVTHLTAANHPAGKVAWSSLVIPPGDDRDGNPQPAYVATSTDDYKDGFAGLSTLHGIVSRLREANGESPLPVQYYAPLIARNAAGVAQGAGGGIGGGSVGTGDTSYAGIFIHEQGHAFGLPHAGGSYDSGDYPYAWGSLNGSAWGYDVNHDELLAPFLPTTASTYSGCKNDTFGGHARAVDSADRCVKQDPMQSGSGDQASGYRYATFSDYSTAVMQGYFEGRTERDSGGSHSYDGGKLVRDNAYASGYRRWDSIDQQWVEADISTEDYGLWGFNRGTAIQYGVPVYAIVVTLSRAGTAGATQIYPPIAYTGNLLKQIDPTNDADRASINPDTGAYDWFCEYDGCDFTVRVRYSNGSVRHVLLQDGFRGWFDETGPESASASDPLDGDSFRTWAVNVPADVSIAGIDLLYTPKGWEGVPLLPTVLATR